jgi:hypothetical protein
MDLALSFRFNVKLCCVVMCDRERRDAVFALQSFMDGDSELDPAKDSQANKRALFTAPVCGRPGLCA